MGCTLFNCVTSHPFLELSFFCAYERVHLYLSKKDDNNMSKRVEKRFNHWYNRYGKYGDIKDV